MTLVTYPRRWLMLLLMAVCLAGTAQAQRAVTLQLNTATLPDTTSTLDGTIQVRGCYDGCSGNQSTLIDNNVIAWNDNTTLIPENAGGDYWNITFDVHPDSTLKFKFYSQQAEDVGIGGWEDGSDHELDAGDNDTTLTLHFFEKGADQPYDWRPFESKEDSVAVHFRVYMNTEEALGAGIGYDRDDANQIIGVRGNDFGGASPLDWGSTDFLLAPESDDLARPGYHIFSGTAYFSNEIIGETQAYKFVVDQADMPSDDQLGWESSPDRTFTIPAEDTTLHWVYFSNSPPSSGIEPVESLLLFAVDLSPFEDIGIFDPARGDTLWVFGGFNSWGDCPDLDPTQCLMEPVPNENTFEAAVLVEQVPGTNIAYKYFLDFNDETFVDAFGVEPPSGWEEGHNTGTNRIETFEGGEEQDLGTQFFNDITPGNVVPAGTSITVNFEVDMSPAFDLDTRPFQPEEGDSVTIRVGDPIWAFTQGVTEDPRGDGDFPLFINELLLTDDDNDDVYTGSYTVEGPTYNALTFRFAYGQGSDFGEDAGSGTNEAGRNRVVYLDKNPDGTYAAETTIMATFNTEGPLPFERNPEISVGIETVSDEVPTSIRLEQNYPNPFNPATTFEYAITQRQHVRLVVYDVLGRAVATLVDGLQPAATYQVTFDGSALASGVYLYRLETEAGTLTRQMLLVK